jgi:hypothetical protein
VDSTEVVAPSNVIGIHITVVKYTVKKAFCFSFPSENSITKDRQSHC